MTSLAITQDRLLALRAELSQRVDAIKRDASSAHSSDSVEQSQERENDEVMDSIGHETMRELSLVNRALLRIEEGDYGVCDNCGDDIDPRRLDALPFAVRCVKCAD